MSVAAAPLVFAGPPGWLVLGVIGLATVGAVYAMSDKAEAADEGADTSLGQQSTTSACSDCGDPEDDENREPDPEEDAETGKQIDPADRDGKLTRAGRALQKHGSRPGSVFPQARGNPSAMNEQGQSVLDKIVRDPGKTVTRGNRFGGYDVKASNGQGARFDSGGTFRGFLEP